MSSTPKQPRRRGSTTEPPDDGSTVADSVGTLGRIVLCLFVAGALSSQRLVDTAEGLPFGRTRSVLLPIADAVDRRADAVHLDEPDRILRRLTGAEMPDGDGPVPSDPQHLADTPTTTITPEPILGPPRPPAGAQPPPGRPAAPTSGTAPTSTTTPTPPPTSASTATPDPPHHRVVSEDDKLRLWAGGDSLGEYVGNQLLSPVGDATLAEVTLDYHISTGLARPDFFDWPRRIEELMTTDEPPEALVFMVGGNDDQNMQAEGEILTLGSAPWLEEYRRRVATIMDATRSDEGRLYWLGLPPMRDQRREDISLEISRITSEEAADRPWVTFVDIVPLFSASGGGFTSHVIDRDGRQRLARAPDGVHITYTGSTWIAEQVWAAIANRWRFVSQLSEPLAPSASPAEFGPLRS